MPGVVPDDRSFHDVAERATSRRTAGGEDRWESEGGQQYSTLAGGGFRIHGRAFFTDTGGPLRRQKLATAYDSGCDFGGGAVGRTGGAR